MLGGSQVRVAKVGVPRRATAQEKTMLNARKLFDNTFKRLTRHDKLDPNINMEQHNYQVYKRSGVVLTRDERGPIVLIPVRYFKGTYAGRNTRAVERYFEKAGGGWESVHSPHRSRVLCIIGRPKPGEEARFAEKKIKGDEYFLEPVAGRGMKGMVVRVKAEKGVSRFAEKPPKVK